MAPSSVTVNGTSREQEDDSFDEEPTLLVDDEEDMMALQERLFAKADVEILMAEEKERLKEYDEEILMQEHEERLAAYDEDIRKHELLEEAEEEKQKLLAAKQAAKRAAADAEKKAAAQAEKQADVATKEAIAVSNSTKISEKQSTSAAAVATGRHSTVPDCGRIREHDNSSPPISPPPFRGEPSKSKITARSKNRMAQEQPVHVNGSTANEMNRNETGKPQQRDALESRTPPSSEAHSKKKRVAEPPSQKQSSAQQLAAPTSNTKHEKTSKMTGTAGKESSLSNHCQSSSSSRAKKRPRRLPGLPTALCRMRKLFPHRLDPSEPPLLSPKILQEVVSSFEGRTRLRGDKDCTGRSKSSLAAQIEVEVNNSVIVMSEGPPRVLKSFSQYLEHWLQCKVQEFNSNSLKRSSVRACVRLDSPRSLGVTVKKAGGLVMILPPLDPQGELAQILGPRAFDCGAAISRINGQSPPKVADLKGAIGSKRKLDLDILLHSDFDRSGVQLERLRRPLTQIGKRSHGVSSTTQTAGRNNEKEPPIGSDVSTHAGAVNRKDVKGSADTQNRTQSTSGLSDTMDPVTPHGTSPKGAEPAAATSQGGKTTDGKPDDDKDSAAVIVSLALDASQSLGAQVQSNEKSGRLWLKLKSADGQLARVLGLPPKDSSKSLEVYRVGGEKCKTSKEFAKRKQTAASENQALHVDLRVGRKSLDLSRIGKGCLRKPICYMNGKEIVISASPSAASQTNEDPSTIDGGEGDANSRKDNSTAEDANSKKDSEAGSTTDISNKARQNSSKESSGCCKVSFAKRGPTEEANTAKNLLVSAGSSSPVDSKSNKKKLSATTSDGDGDGTTKAKPEGQDHENQRAPPAGGLREKRAVATRRSIEESSSSSSDDDSGEAISKVASLSAVATTAAASSSLWDETDSDEEEGRATAQRQGTAVKLDLAKKGHESEDKHQRDVRRHSKAHTSSSDAKRSLVDSGSEDFFSWNEEISGNEPLKGRGGQPSVSNKTKPPFAEYSDDDNGGRDESNEPLAKKQKRLSLATAGDGAGNNRNGSSNAQSLGAPERPHTPGRATNKDHYNSFKEKYKNVAILEFRGSGIKVNSAAGSMWKRHKEYFGLECRENCKCVFDMQTLGESVVSDLLEKPDFENKANLKAGEFPAGFMTHFAGKFLESLLQPAFPKETSTQLLGRLVKMWDCHVKQKSFGLRCGRHCDCLQGWDAVFNHGDPGSAPLKIHQSNKRKAHSVAADDPFGQTAVPKKVPRKSRTTSHQDLSQRKEYSVEFESSEPLGLYCCKGDGGSCQVKSVSPYGQAKSDCRIQPGTTVMAYSIGNDDRKELVGGHLALQVAFAKAKQREWSKLTLVFKNERIIVPPHSKKETNWNEKNQWVGPHSKDHGWAGGAHIVHEVDGDQDQGSYAATTTPTQPKTATGAAATASTVPAEPHWLEFVSDKEPPHESLRPTPILRCTVEKKDEQGRVIIVKKKNKGSSIRRVKFTSEFETRGFVRDSMAVEYLAVAGSEGIGATRQILSRTTALKMLEEAIAPAKSFQGLLNHLEDEVAANLTSDDINDLLLRVKNSSGSLDREIRDLDFKKRLLKIYCNAEVRIKHAKALKHWVDFEIFVDKVEFANGRRPPSAHNRLGVRPVAVMDKGCDDEQLEVLESDFRTSTVRFGDRPDKPYRMRHNAISNAGRAFKLNLYTKASGSKDITSRPYGSVMVTCATLFRKCAQEGQCEEVMQLSPKPDGSFDAEVTIRVRRSAIDQEKLDAKRESEARKTGEIISWINRLNKELFKANLRTSKVSANILVGGMSLLHGAVILENEELVEELLALGANPAQKTKLGHTASSLAANMLEGRMDTPAQRRQSLERIKNLLTVNSTASDSDSKSWTSGAVEPVRLDTDKNHNPAPSDHGMMPRRRSLSHASASGGSSSVGIATFGAGEEGKGGTANSGASPAPVTGGHDAKHLLAGRKGDADATSNAQNSTSESQSKLPDLQRLWFLRSEHARKFVCKYKNCSRGSCCPFIHQQEFLATQLEELWHEMNPASVEDALKTYSPYTSMSQYNRNVELIAKSPIRGQKKKLFTGAYSTAVPGGEKRKNQQIIYAEGGNGRKSAEGLYWYEEEDQVQDALAKAVAVTYYKQSARRKQPISSAAMPSRGHHHDKDRRSGSPDGRPARPSGTNLTDRSSSPERRQSTQSERFHATRFSPPEGNRRRPVEGDSIATSARRAPEGCLEAEPANKRSRNSPSARLPTLQQGWLTKERLAPKDQSCSYFNSGKGCRYGKKCHHWHVQKPLGKRLDKLYKKHHQNFKPADGPFFAKHTETVVQPDSSGKMVYTAGYFNSGTKQIFYAEGGKKGRLNDETGVWWYPDKTTAELALRKVMAVSNSISKAQAMAKASGER